MRIVIWIVLLWGISTPASAKFGVDAALDLVRSEPAAHRDVALIVAIEDYDNVPDIPGARANARLWRQWFGARGVTDVRVIEDSDATHQWGRDGKPRGLLRHIDNAAAAARRSKGTLWFVFIGHGAPVFKNGAPQGVLLGHGVRQSADSLETNGIFIEDDLIPRLSQARNAVAVIDACFSGRDTTGGALVPGLQPLIPISGADPKSVTVFTAAKGSQVAGSLTGANRPAFSYLMLAALAGLADGELDRRRDQQVTSPEAFEWVKAQMASHIRGRSQTPTLRGPIRRLSKAWAAGMEQATPTRDQPNVGLHALPTKLAPPAEPRPTGPRRSDLYVVAKDGEFFTTSRLSAAGAKLAEAAMREALPSHFKRAKVNTTRLKLMSVENALRQYSIDNGYPSQNEGLGVLVNPPGGEKPYLAAKPRDAWNNDILYFRFARKGKKPFVVVSKGPDGKVRTKDDIYSAEHLKDVNASVTRLKLMSVENALRQYSIDNGYPSQNEGLGVLVNPPGGEKPYLAAKPRDAWNNDILYFRIARKGKNPFVVVSKGPDGKEGTKDDIYSALHLKRAKVSTTRLKLKSVENALRQYSIDNGYPSQNEGLGVLVNPPGGEKPYLAAKPRDSWNNDILYFRPARNGKKPFEVVSKGPDGKEGTKDDVYANKRK